MNILQVTSSLNPAYGGVAACIQAITPELALLGHESEVVSLDDPGAPFLQTFPGKVFALGPGKSGYEYTPALVPWLQREAKRFDAVVVHGLWQYHSLAVHRALRRAGDPPYFVFSHGMLDPWFKRQYPLKHLKKLLYWWPAERRVLRDAAAVLFTCEEERVLARQSFAGYRCREQVVAFGTVGASGGAKSQEEAFYTHLPQLRERAFWLFLGRIHEKKGVDLLIDAYANLAPQTSVPRPVLVVAGPCSDKSLLEDLQRRATPCGPNVVWAGMIVGDQKWGALRAAEAFVLPSHQENFGIAVAEALSCGTPVLISDKVNIWREIKMDKAGLVASDDLSGTRELLERWESVDDGARQAMRKAAQDCFERRFAIKSAALNLVEILERHASGMTAG